MPLAGAGAEISSMAETLFGVEPVAEDVDRASMIQEMQAEALCLVLAVVAVEATAVVGPVVRVEPMVRTLQVVVALPEQALPEETVHPAPAQENVVMVVEVALVLEALVAVEEMVELLVAGVVEEVIPVVVATEQEEKLL